MTALTDRLLAALGLDAADAPWVDSYTEVALAAIRNYTRRYLYPVATFRDTFHNATFRKGLVPLSEFPIVTIKEVKAEGNVVPSAQYTPQPAGYLQLASGWLGCMEMSVEFDAGYETLPEDIYIIVESVLRDLRVQYDSGGVGNPTRVSVIDAGSVEYGVVGSAYQSAALSKVADPLLGPWGVLLDAYRDQAKTFWHTDVRFSTRVIPPPSP